MDFDRVNTSPASTSSSVSTVSTRENEILTWRQRCREGMQSTRSFSKRLFKPTTEREIALVGTSFIATISLTIYILYTILFVWYPKSQYSLSSHNFISENEASQVDGLARWREDFSRNVIPIMCHSHNDYWRAHPLFSALAAGCVGVEADVWLNEDETDLLVGHDRRELKPDRTLRSLYLDPIMTLLDDQNPDDEWRNHTVYDRARGIFPSSPNQTLTLLIDVKGDYDKVQQMWELVEKQLKPLSDKQYLMFHKRVFPKPGFIERQTVWPAPITVVGTGNMDRGAYVTWFSDHRQFHSDDPWEEDHTDWYRDFFIDAPLGSLPEDNKFGKSYDDDGKVNSTWSYMLYHHEFAYYASTSFAASIGNVKFGFSEAQLAKLRSQIWTARKSGLLSRYWDLPSWPISLRDHVWEVLTREGVDMLSVDDLESAARRSWSTGYLMSVVWMFIAAVAVAGIGAIALLMICKTLKVKHELLLRRPGPIMLA